MKNMIIPEFAKKCRLEKDNCWLWSKTCSDVDPGEPFLSSVDVILYVT